MNTRTAFIAIVGCPNAGKSSILNRIIGQKVSIVSPKPHTTRNRITGIRTWDDGVQLVFTDTPGFDKPKTRFDNRIQHAVTEGIRDVDACLLVVEPRGEIRRHEEILIERFREHSLPAVLAINKIDLLEDRSELLARIAEFSKLYDFEAVVPLSAKFKENIDELVTELKKLSVPSPHFFPDDALTDLTERQIAADVVREKLLKRLDFEVPHGTAVVIEKYAKRENKDITDISAVIYCEKDSHKGIIIGKGGSMLKAIGTDA
ncbi:MAG: GTPase Era, partial [Clostridia bacterium]|nr:GTPase Era [Clostridia bacterium]